MAVDRWALHGIETLRTPGLRELFVVLSAWWLKSAGMLAVAAGADLLARSRLPRATLAGAAAVALGSLCADLLKDATGRHRPPQAEALVHLPHSAAFPSGHATTAFAAAIAIGLVRQRLLAPLVLLAAAIGFSRLYLGVHWPSDVLAGAILGAALGWLVAWALGRLAPGPARAPRDRGSPRRRSISLNEWTSWR